MHDGDSASSSSSSSEFLSHFASLRHTTNTGAIASETLPAPQDVSWIGARMSPIVFDEDEEDLIIAPYRQPLANDSFFSTERSALLGSRRALERSKIHPLWDEESGTIPPIQKPVHRECDELSLLGACVWLGSGVHLSCIGIHDLYLFYISFRLGYNTDVVGWRLPWFTPGDFVLERFGAFVPWEILAQEQWWRMLSSAFICTSLVEWILVFLSWRALHVGGRPPPSRIWVFLYIMSILTGELWMMAWDLPGISGGVSWGTCGILCAVSRIKSRRHRLLLLGLSLSFMGVAFVGPCGSIVATFGSSAFGWLFYGLGCNQLPPRKEGHVRYAMGCIFAAMLMALWMVPLLVVAFRKEQHTPNPFHQPQ